MRLAIMSFAHLHAEAYIHNLRAMPDVEMIGIADDDPERGRHFASQFDAHLFPSYEALLAEKPDGVLVCSENARHRPLVEMAAEAGAHVLSEKPLATTLEDAQAMLDACDKAGVHLMTAFPMRFNVPALEIKRLVEAGTLGQIYGCNAANQGQMPVHHRAWFVDKALAGGGAVMDHTVHLADLLRWYLQCEATEVFAETNAILYGDSGVEVETGGLLMLTFEDGTFATIDTSWNKPPYYSTWGGLKLDLVGEKGLATMDAFRQGMTVWRHATERPAWMFWGSDANQAMIDEFAAAIRENRTPSVTGFDGYKALEIVLAAYRSAETGQPVALPLE